MSINTCAVILFMTFILIPRILIKLHGMKIFEFLQSSSTKNFVNFQEKADGVEYTCFLNSIGRVVCDSFIYKCKEDIYLDCHQRNFDQLENIIRRSNFGYEIEDKFKIFHTFINQTLIPANSVCGIDPRGKFLGKRLITKELIDQFKNSYDYENYRFELGICEGPEMSDHQAIPHEFNLDLLNTLSFDKGCYIGQELISRIEHKGVVRKRLCPFEFQISNNIPLLPTLFCKNELNQNINCGKLICSNNNRGCVLIKLEFLTRKHFLLDENDNEVNINIYKPDWWTIN